MMFPPLFAIASVDTSVTALLGDSPVRFFPFGEAEANPVLPYAVWQTVFGTPENYLGDLPDTDRFGIQLDVYAHEASEARQIAQVLRAVFEPHAYVTSYNGESRDPVTRNYRYSLTVDWIVHR